MLTVSQFNVRGRADSGAPEGTLAATLPAGLSLGQALAGALRAFLADRGLEDYRIFYGSDGELSEIDSFLRHRLEDPTWEPWPALVPDGEQPDLYKVHGRSPGWRPSGFLWLRQRNIVLARACWMEFEGYGRGTRQLIICAAASEQDYRRLHEELVAHQRRRACAVWQVIGSEADEPRTSRASPGSPEDLLLPTEIRQRLETEVIGFFSPAAAALYGSLRVPYRRGVLLHGPPGNGKTSIIRWIGSELPDVPAMILRPSADFDDDTLQGTIYRWTHFAPAMLVIEDLDWMLKKVNVSTFLNLIDGVDSSATASDALLLIATTNHPETLDPAINNRPGRFDVVIEIPCPDDGLRRLFFQQRMPELPERTLARLVEETRRLSFCHLQEILRLSGFIAIGQKRATRNTDDVLAAMKIVVQSNEAAMKGYARPLDMPFGLASLHQHRRAQVGR